MKRSFTCLLVLALGLFFCPAAGAGGVSISDQGSYYKVVIDLNGASAEEVYAQYAEAILGAVPEFESLMDSYLSELVGGNQAALEILISRANQIKGQIPEEYRQAVEAMAARFGGAGSAAVAGDGKLSVDEAWVLNLLTDVYRATACSAISVFGSRSATGSTITGRVLDWENGSQAQLTYVQAVTTIKNGGKSICLIGWLGQMGAVTAVSDDGVFAAVLDSATDQPYSASGKRSYVFDLRWALENYTTLDEVASYMVDSGKPYAFGHLIFLADASTSKVVENDLSGHRAVRSADSSLRDGASWGFSHAIAAVNCFMLPGSVDHYGTWPENSERWASFRRLLEEAGSPVDAEQVKAMVAYHSGATPGESDGDIYNYDTQQLVLFQPAGMSLQVAFHPKDIATPDTPQWETVSIGF